MIKHHSAEACGIIFYKNLSDGAIKLRDWIKVAGARHPEDGQVLIHYDKNSRIEFGRYLKGKWYIEDTQSGNLCEIAGATNCAWMLDSETDDDDED